MSDFAPEILVLAHVLVGEPDPTLGSSPRARFAGTCAGSISPHDTDKFHGESKRSAGPNVDFRWIAAARFFQQIIECPSCPESIASPPVHAAAFLRDRSTR
jgi:hypothetical protein